MTKADNRAAAKAYAAEKERKFQEERRKEAAAADLKELGALRHYLMFDLKSGLSPDALIKAIDDFAERLTGDRRALHAKNHSIGK
jgi:hypothetical protein